MYIIFSILAILSFTMALRMFIQGGYGEGLDLEFPSLDISYSSIYKEKIEEIESFYSELCKKHNKFPKLKFMMTGRRNALTTNYSYNQPCIFIDVNWFHINENVVKTILCHEYYHAINNHSGVIARVHSVIMMIVSLAFFVGLIYMQINHPIPDSESLGSVFIKFHVVMFVAYIFFAIIKILLSIRSRYLELKADKFAMNERGIDEYENFYLVMKELYPASDIKSFFNSHPTLDQRLDYVKNNLSEGGCIKIALMLK